MTTALAPFETARASSDPEIPDAEHATSETGAREIARVHKHDVVVDSLSTPTLLISAQPDGYMKAVSSQVPEQARIGGAWKPVDPRLIKRDSWWEPTIAAVPVRIGIGGNPEIVSVRSGSGEWVTEIWPYGSLPTPVVRKSTATFRDVLPDVDLRVTATKAGMREVLVIKSATAAADERVAALHLTVRGASLTASEETGALEAHLGGGQPLMAATPLWWDSSSESADADTMGGSEPRAVETSVAGADAVLDIGRIAHSAVNYPLYVDPDWSGYLQYDWYTDRAYPNQGYLNPAENSVGYGIQNGVGYLSRAFYRFDTAFLAGKSVQKAAFSVVQTWANSCASTMTQLWQYGTSGVGFTWNSDPGQWVRAVDAQGYNIGGPCSPNPAWEGFTATAAVQDTAARSAPYLTLALRTADEGNSLSRKHFRWDAQLTVTYNSRPNVPSGASMISPERGCSTDPSKPGYISGREPLTLQVTASDPDPGNVAANFFLTTVATGASRLLTVTPLQAQGAALRTTIAADTLSEGTLYSWTTEASDHLEVSAAKSPPCYFVVDSAVPALPALTVVTANTPDADKPGTVMVPSSVGAPMTVHIAPSPGAIIVGYQLWWGSSAATETSPEPPVTRSVTGPLPPCNGQGQAARFVCADATGAADVVVAPPAPISTLWVTAYSRSGVSSSSGGAPPSAAAGLAVRAGNPDLTTGHAWVPIESGGKSVDDSVGSVNLALGSVSGWASAADEDPQFTTPALVTLNRLVRGGVGHWTNSSFYDFPGGYGLQVITGQIRRAEPGEPAPAGAVPFYACAFGAGNMMSTTANCEGVASNPTLLGYAWASAAAVPAGFAPVQIYRCRIGSDYFLSTESPCEGGVNEGSRGYVARVTATVSESQVVDTRTTFSVSARVKPDRPASQGTQAVVGTTGATQSAFFLEAAGSNWRFCIRAQGPTKAIGCVTGASIDTTRFATVTGSWDAINQMLSISVLTGQALSTKTAYFALPADDVASTGVITVGSAIERGMPSDFFSGAIADVSIYPTLLTDRSLRQLPVPLP